MTLSLFSFQTQSYNLKDHGALREVISSSLGFGFIRESVVEMKIPRSLIVDTALWRAEFGDNALSLVLEVWLRSECVLAPGSSAMSMRPL